MYCEVIDTIIDTTDRKSILNALKASKEYLSKHGYESLPSIIGGLSLWRFPTDQFEDAMEPDYISEHLSLIEHYWDVDVGVKGKLWGRLDSKVAQRLKVNHLTTRIISTWSMEVNHSGFKRTLDISGRVIQKYFNITDDALSIWKEQSILNELTADKINGERYTLETLLLDHLNEIEDLIYGIKER